MHSSSDPNVNVAVTATTDELATGMSQAAEIVRSGTAEIDHQFGEMSEGVGESLKSITELLGVAFSLDVVKEFGLGIVELETQMQHMSDTFGISVQGLSDLNAAAVLADSSLDNVTAGMTRIQRAAAQAGSGSAQMSEAFRALGITTAELKSLSPDELFTKTAESLTEMAPSAEKTANMMQLFGRNIAGLYPVLQQLAGGAKEFAAAYNAVVTPTEAAQAELFSQSLGHVKLAFQGIGESVLANVLPALTAAANAFAMWASTSVAVQNVFDAIGNGAVLVADHLQGIIVAASALAGLGIESMLVGWAEKLAAIATEAEGVTGAFAAAGTAAVSAVALGAAAFGGWQLGTWAHENFAWADDIGAWIVQGIMAAKGDVVASFETIWTAVKGTFGALVAGIESNLAAPFQFIADQLNKTGFAWAQGAAQSFSQISTAIAPAKTASQQLGDTWSSLTGIWTGFVGQLKSDAATFGEIRTQTDAQHASLDALKDSFAAVSTEAAKGHLTGEQYAADMAKIGQASQAAIAAGNDQATVAKMTGQAYALLGTSLEEAAGQTDTYKAKVAGVDDSASKLVMELLAWDKAMDSLSGKMGDAYAKANGEFEATLDGATKSLIEMMGNGLSLADALKMLDQVIDDGTVIMNKSIAADVTKNDLADDTIQKLKDQVAQLGDLTSSQKASADFDAIAAKNAVTLHDAYGELHDSMEEVVTANAELKTGFVSVVSGLTDEANAVKANATINKQWASDFSSGLDSLGGSVASFVTGGIKSWKDFGNALMDDTKQFINVIIEEFLKLTIFNGIVNSLFGLSGSSALPTGLGNGLIGSLLGGGGGSGGLLGAAQTGNNVFSGLSTGNGLMGWLFGSNAVTTSGVGDVLGDYTGFGTQDLNYGGSFDFAADQGGTYAGDGFDASTAGTGAEGGMGLGQVLGIAGGAFAGYNEFNNAGGGLGGLAGGAAYGLGTVALGGAAAGALGAGLGGGLAGLGAGAAAGEATAMAGLGVIPVIGWVALAAMVLDKVTGGGLFGTDGKVVSGQTYLNTTDTGASVDASLNLKGKKALFGGSTWSTKDIDPGSDAEAAANAFYAALRTGTDDFAKQFGLTAGTVVDATFKTVLDNKGKPTGETETTIGGKDFKNETQAQFQERVQASDITADLLTAGINISKYTDGAISDADAWAKSVQDAAAAAVGATADIKNGFDFLGLTGPKTVQNLLDFAAANEKAGEDVGQAYQRLEQAQASYNTFVGQFKPAATYVDDFEASLSNINATLNANVAQANALAVAAGAAGASESDLANIHKSAIAQEQQLISQLEASAQGLAFSLGLSNTGTLDQVNSEIQQLQSQAGQGASSLQGFGTSITQVSQAATNAMNLLLGTDSPLNDQEKLQQAKIGLVKGTVTSQQADDIARRLYASGQQYTDFFNWAQQFAGNGAGGAGAGSSATGVHGLSSADQAKLADLLKQQATLTAAAQLQQAQTLAQQIAEISAAKGEDFQQVLDEMKIKDADLEKMLGLKDDAALKTYLGNIQTQTDSNQQNTTTLVNTLNNGFNAVVNALGGTLGGGHSTHSQPGNQASYSPVGPIVPPGHSSHGNSMFVPPQPRGLRA